MMHVMYLTPHPREQTDACENVTFPKLRLRAVISHNKIHKLSTKIARITLFKSGKDSLPKMKSIYCVRFVGVRMGSRPIDTILNFDNLP